MRVLEVHIGNDSGKDFCLAGAWRSLDKGDSLTTSVGDSFLLTDVVLRHSVGIVLKHKLISAVEGIFRDSLPDAFLDVSLGRGDHAFRHMATLLNR